MNFCTHRCTQPVSRWMMDLVVKSSTQESKQWETRLENICGKRMISFEFFEVCTPVQCSVSSQLTMMIKTPYHLADLCIDGCWSGSGWWLQCAMLTKLRLYPFLSQSTTMLHLPARRMKKYSDLLPWIPSSASFPCEHSTLSARQLIILISISFWYPPIDESASIPVHVVD